MLDNYRDVFALKDFRRFWIGASLSMFGDSMTRMAFVWFVYQQTNSAAALGILMICYTGPVIGGRARRRLGPRPLRPAHRHDRRLHAARCAIALVPLFIGSASWRCGMSTPPRPSMAC